MDVDQVHFNVHLLPILRHIANAEFVAFDLEMSGIGSSPKRDGKPNLQEVYDDVKSAAETYQVLQVGITCIEKDEENDMYIARPYNFNLSPLFLEKERLGIERKFSFSSGACHFLLGEKVLFDIAAPFKTGVPYLSRDEEDYARKKFTNVSYSDVNISPGDVDALQFYRKARQIIKDWLAEPKGKDKLHYVNIFLTGRYGVRLVHQLVRSEFPDLLARYVRDCEFMQVTVRDDEREALIAKNKLTGFEHNVAKQIGLRFIFEAIFGGDLSKINPKWFCIDKNGKPSFVDVEAKQREIDEIVQSLKVRRPALVGHNVHLDLAFMYKTFIGNLPETYQEFGSNIHNLCPIVIDTKYLATHNCGSMDTKSDLEGLLETLSYQALPFVCLAEQHSTYGGKHKSHEAGYDSWMTAQVLVKLAAKLEAAQNAARESALKPKENGKSKTTTYRSYSPSHSSDDSSDNGGVSLLDLDNEEFDQLMTIRQENEKARIRALAKLAAKSTPKQNKRPKLMGPGEEVELGMDYHMIELNGGRIKRTLDATQPGQWIPDWDSPFWKDYVNKLRVFQAEEGHYVLQDM